MNVSVSFVRVRTALLAVGCAALAGLTVTAPLASAAPACDAATVANTVRTTATTAQQYLDGHPDANAAVTSALNEPRL